MAFPSEEIDFSDLQFHEKLGEGGGGTVNRITFKQGEYKGYKQAAAKSVRDLRKEEVEILSKVNHPNIVSLIGFYHNGPVNILLMEYTPHGSLHEYLSKAPDEQLPDELVRKWAKESALALQHLHENNTVHRDVKPQNCILFEGNTLKLCDFGLARELDHSQSTSSQKGTHHYMAPEIIKTNDRDHATYSRYSDVYAYGMLLLTIITRKEPFDGMEWAYVVFHVGKGVLQPTVPPSCPDDLSELMKRCWMVNPRRRPSFDSIIQDYFLGNAAMPNAAEQDDYTCNGLQPKLQDSKELSASNFTPIPNSSIAQVQQSELHLNTSPENRQALTSDWPSNLPEGLPRDLDDLVFDPGNENDYDCFDLADGYEDYDGYDDDGGAYDDYDGGEYDDYDEGGAYDDFDY